MSKCNCYCWCKAGNCSDLSSCSSPNCCCEANDCVFKTNVTSDCRPGAGSSCYTSGSQKVVGKATTAIPLAVISIIAGVISLIA
eukprot:1208449-Ditylum_brightwellii.AAC.1